MKHIYNYVRDAKYSKYEIMREYVSTMYYKLLVKNYFS